MAKYKVHVTFTPDDRDSDRVRNDTSFESDSPDKAKVAKTAIEAWQAAKGLQHDVERFIELFMEKGWEEDDLYDQNLCEVWSSMRSGAMVSGALT